MKLRFLKTIIKLIIEGNKKLNKSQNQWIDDKEKHQRSEPSSAGYESGCTAHPPRFWFSHTHIWVLIITKTPWKLPLQHFFQKKRQRRKSVN